MSQVPRIVIASLSGVVGALFVVAATWTADRLGGTLGGLVSTIPSTIVVASIALALSTEDLKDVRYAMMGAPAGPLPHSYLERNTADIHVFVLQADFLIMFICCSHGFTFLRCCRPRGQAARCSPLSRLLPLSFGPGSHFLLSFSCSRSWKMVHACPLF